MNKIDVNENSKQFTIKVIKEKKLIRDKNKNNFSFLFIVMVNLICYLDFT